MFWGGRKRARRLPWRLVTAVLAVCLVAPTAPARGGLAATDMDTFSIEAGLAGPSPSVAAASAGPTWRHSDRPLARAYGAMAYDAARQRVVLFGGDGNYGSTADTWSWDGATWTERHPGISPTVREGHSMVYDAARGEVVLFGGRSDATRPGGGSDTWVWDGVTWAQRHPRTSPPPRSYAGMAYDAARGVVVLFGGWCPSGACGTYSDTWTWDGFNWTQQSPPLSPPERLAPSLAYDAKRREVVLFGGASFSSGYLGDTWVWNGSTWAQRSVTVSPSARYLAGMDYDAARKEIVLFGGANWASDDGYTPGTWAWDGARWRQLAPSSSPARRQTRMMVYDGARRRLVLFGGCCDSGRLSDTWTWDGRAWSPWSRNGPRPVHNFAAMAYHHGSGTAVLAGAACGEGCSITWSWDGSSWSQRTPSRSPASGLWAGMASHPPSHSVVLFGGCKASYCSSDTLSGETWSWNGQDWTKQPEQPWAAPPARYAPALAYDSERSNVVLFGGNVYDALTASFVAVGDTWTWNGERWTEKVTGLNTAPPPRGYAAMAYDPGKGRAVLFGGFLRTNVAGVLLGDTWVWDGARWEHKNPLVSPGARMGHVMAYDPGLQKVIMFGGSTGDELVNDTWAWDGEEWLRLAPEAAPAARWFPAATTHEATKTIVLFGGQLDTHALVDETWVWDARALPGAEMGTPPQ